MGMLRKLSRSAHPEAWAALTRFRRLRRLTQQGLRAKERRDESTMLRVAALLRRFHEEDIFADEQVQEAAVEPTLVQKGVSGIEEIEP